MSTASVDPYEGTIHLWNVPGVSTITLDRKRLRAFLIATGGVAMAQGHLWEIKSKHLGAGAYSVTLKEKQ